MKTIRFAAYLKRFDMEGHGYSEEWMNELIEAIENVDPSPTGEWVIEFMDNQKEPWRMILGEPIAFDFDAANKILCQLVKDNAIYVVDERKNPLGAVEWVNACRPIKQSENLLRIAQLAAGAFGSNREITADGTEIYRYTLRFDNPLTSYRIRNKVTGEMVMGDALRV